MSILNFPFILALALIGYVFVSFLLMHNHFFMYKAFMLNIVVAMLFASLWIREVPLNFTREWWLILTLLLTVVLISTYSSENITASSIKAGLDGAVLLFGLVLFVMFRSVLSKHAPSILALIVILFLFLATPTTLADFWLVDETRTGFWPVYFERGSLTGLTFYNHIRHFSYHAFIASCCSLMLVLWAQDRTTLLKWVTRIAALACIVSLVLAEGRGSMLALVAFMFFLSYFRKGFKASIVPTIAVVAVMGVILIVLSFSPLSDNFGADMASRSSLSENSLNKVSSGRIVFWTGAISSGMESPIIGHGAASYNWQDIWGAGEKFHHPHNFVLQFVVEYGFIGALLIIFALFRFLAPYYRVSMGLRENKEAMVPALFSFILAYLFFGLFDGLLYHPLPMLHLMVITAIMVSRSQLEDRTIEHEKEHEK